MGAVLVTQGTPAQGELVNLETNEVKKSKLLFQRTASTL